MGPPSRPLTAGRPSLLGRWVRLEPLDLDHVRPLFEAASEARDTYDFTFVPATLEGMQAYVEEAIVADDQVAFATIARDSGRVVGSTRFLSMEQWAWPPDHPLRREGVPDAVEIGSTWLAVSAQRTGINTEAKLLMLSHAFEVWRVHRVSLRTDRRNERSRRAIERIGANLEGIRRAERPGADGTVRDTAAFSIVASEWPAVRRRLQTLIDRRAGSASAD